MCSTWWGQKVVGDDDDDDVVAAIDVADLLIVAEMLCMDKRKGLR